MIIHSFNRETSASLMSVDHETRTLRCDAPSWEPAGHLCNLTVNHNCSYFPMQKVEKIKLRMSSEVVCPVSESSAQSPR